MYYSALCWILKKDHLQVSKGLFCATLTSSVLWPMNSSHCSVLGLSASSPQLGMHWDLITASWAMLGFILFVSNFSGIMIFHCLIASVFKILIQYILFGFFMDRDVTSGRVNLVPLTLSWLKVEILSYLVFFIQELYWYIFPYHTIYLFKVHKSMVFSITELCNHYHHQLYIFITPNRNFLPISNHSAFPSTPSFLALGNH